ncbi:MAG TPA: macro domain-containing protein [Gammaproteobacteria bacterium]|nr:macro domain-containing protein [Xanthomonadales bacterium]HPQ87909.1 macro domain-containing protein [Gammaproteobacteria bacterium]
MKVINGNLITLALQGEFDVIIHGCNCFCSMDAGIAKSIKQAFPQAWQADLKTPKGDKNKLGTFSQAEITLKNRHTLTVINAYTQFHWSGNSDLVEYESLRKIFTQIKLQFHGKRIGYPQIGAGLAGGNWQKISQIIDEELKGENHTLVIFDGS